QRRVLEAKGWQANSVLLPDGKYHSYQGTPFEVPLGLAGAFADATQRPLSDLEKTEPFRDVAAQRLFFGTLDLLASRTGLETLGQISNMIHGFAEDPSQAMRQYGTGLVANLIGNWVPGAGTLRGLARMSDVTARQPSPGDLGQA